MSAPLAFSGLRARLRRRIPTTVAFLDLGSPVSAEVTAQSGFDHVVVDLEHGAGDEATARHQIRGAEGWAPALVRTPDGPAQVARMLDAGAAGVIFPRLTGAREAASAAAGVRYACTRGVSGLARSAGYGRHDERWREESDAAVACVVQIERREALDELDAIAALPDVDGLLVGPNDLANALGCALDLGAPPLRDAVRAVADACRRDGKTAGLFLPAAELGPEWAAEGFSLLSCSFESGLLATASARAATQLREALAG